jgi:hypothetical protein
MSENDENQDKLSQYTVSIRPDSDTQTYDANIGVSLNEATKNELNEAAEKLGIDGKAAAYRYFLTMGVNAIFETDPRGSTDSTEGSDAQYEPLTIRDVLPVDEEEALNMKEDEVVDAISEKLMNEVNSDPKIKTNGWNVWLEN